MKRLKYVKIIIVYLIIISGCISVSAKNCTTIRYYSKKGWVEYSNLIDTSFSDKDSATLNSKDVLIQINAFGNHSFPLRINSDSLINRNDFTVLSSELINELNYFSISLGTDIKVSEIQFEIDVFDSKLNKINKTLYLGSNVIIGDDGYELVGGKQIYSGTDDLVSLKINDIKTNSIHMTFDNKSKDCTYVLKSFKVLKYKVFEHVEWTLDEIKNTEYKDVLICANNGVYEPNGNIIWEKVVSSAFMPDSSIAIDYEPIITNQTGAYDFGRGNYIGAYSEPNVIKSFDSNAKKIKGFTKSGSAPYIIWNSYGDGGEKFPYIISDASKSGVTYKSKPIYWSQTKGNKLISTSYDQNWCSHTTGSMSVPCYKHSGHSTNKRLNSYDLTIITYKNVVDPVLRVIDYVDYYLVDTDTGKRKFLMKAKDELQYITIKETGRWVIEAVIYDLFGNHGEIKSEVFHVDNLSPYVVFSENISEYQKPFSIEIDVLDDHSGVQKYRYSISNDNGKSFYYTSDYIYDNKQSSVMISDSGEYVIKVESYDDANNWDISLSTTYVANIKQAQIHQMYSFAYDEIKENLLHFKYGNELDEKNKAIKVDLYLDDNLYYTKDMIVNKVEDIIIPYYHNGTNAINAKLKIIDGNKVSSELLTIAKKDKQIYRSNNDDITIRAVSVSMKSKDIDQIDYYENFNAKLIKQKPSYFAGEGIETYLSYDYYNECINVNNYKCEVGSVNNIDFETYAIFDNGAMPIREDYLNNGNYKIKMLSENSTFSLPNVYVDKKSGEVFRSNNTNLIDGKKRWYTDKKLKKKNYQYQINSSEIGYNEFKFIYDINYEINKKINELYKIRFVDNYKPFSDNYNGIWINDINWFNQLNENDSLYEFSYQKK